MYKLICLLGEDYPIEGGGPWSGDKASGIYGKTSCPSPLHHITKPEDTWRRVFFTREESALNDFFRPCPVCMKEHYQLWMKGQLETHALRIKPAHTGGPDICTVFFPDYGSITLNALDTPGFPEVPSMADESWSDFDTGEFKIQGEFCIISLSSGYVIVWNYVQNQVVYLTSAPRVRSSTVFNGQVVSMYQAIWWFHVVDPCLTNDCWKDFPEMHPPYGTLWYSVTPLGMVDPEYEPDLCLLPIVPEGLEQRGGWVDKPPLFDVRAEDDTLVFRAGTAEYRLESL